MTLAIIKCTVPMMSDRLDHNIETHLLETIKDKYNRSYNKSEEFYILDVMRIIDTSNYVSNANSLTIFKSNCEVETLSMRIGEFMKGTCEIAKGSGIFVHSPNRITKVYIKYDNIVKGGVTYSPSLNAYMKNDKIVFENDTCVKIRIFNRDFINKNFRYIGDEIIVL